MHRKRLAVIVAAAATVIPLVALIAGLPSPLMVPLGIALFVAPGFVWSEVLLTPSVSSLARVAVVAALAMILPTLGGLALYATGVVLHRGAWVALLAGLSIAGVVTLMAQRGGDDAAESGSHSSWRHLPLRHVVTFALAALVAMGAVAVAILGANIQKYPGFTQMWMSPSDRGSVTASLGVTNRQGSTTRYRLVLLRRGRVSATWTLTLANDQTWRRIISFSDRYLIAADLYRLPDLARPYRNVDNGGRLRGA